MSYPHRFHCSRCNALFELVDFWITRFTDKGTLGDLRCLCPSCTKVVAAAATHKVVMI